MEAAELAALQMAEERLGSQGSQEAQPGTKLPWQKAGSPADPSDRAQA